MACRGSGVRIPSAPPKSQVTGHVWAPGRGQGMARGHLSSTLASSLDPMASDVDRSRSVARTARFYARGLAINRRPQLNLTSRASLFSCPTTASNFLVKVASLADWLTRWSPGGRTVSVRPLSANPCRNDARAPSTSNYPVTLSKRDNAPRSSISRLSVRSPPSGVTVSGWAPVRLGEIGQVPAPPRRDRSGGDHNDPECGVQCRTG